MMSPSDLLRINRTIVPITAEAAVTNNMTLLMNKHLSHEIIDIT